MSSLSNFSIDRRSFLSTAAFALGSAFAPSVAFGKSLTDANEQWTEIYRDEELAIYESQPRYKAVELRTGKETISEYIKSGGNRVVITSSDGANHIAESDEAGNVYIDGNLAFEVVRNDGGPSSGTRGCVKMSEYNTTLSAQNKTDAVIIGALSFLPFYGWVLGLVGFAKSVFDLVDNRGEVYFHCVRYYCDLPKPHQKLTTYAYKDAAHKHLISTNTQTIPV